MQCNNTDGCPIAEAGKDLPKTFKTCPGCGMPLRQRKSGCAWIIWLGLIVACGTGLHFLLRELRERKEGGGSVVTTPQPKPPTPHPRPAPSTPVPPKAAPKPTEDPIMAEARRVAATLPFGKLTTVREIAERLSRKGQPDEITDPELLARIFFAWLAENFPYDAEGLWNNDLPTPDPDTTLANGKAVCSGYSVLFTALCQACSIEAFNVIGHSRSLDELGAPRDPNAVGHMWNAVKLEGRWRLLDVTFGAGSVDSQTGFRRKFEPLYFDVPPEHMRYTHLPDIDKWQLAAKPITQSTFYAQPLLRPAYFSVIHKTEPEPEDMSILEVGGDGKHFLRLVPEKGTNLSSSLEHLPGHAGNAPPLPEIDQVDTPNGTLLSIDPQTPAGRYRLIVFAGPAGNSTLGSVGGYIIDWNPGRRSKPVVTESPLVFQPIYGQKNMKLMEPLTRTLPAGEWQNFKVHVPQGALSVFLSVDDSPTYLPRNGNNIFETKMVVPEGKFELRVSLEKNRYYVVTEFEGIKAP